MRKSNFKYFAAMSTVLVLLVGCVPQNSDTADENRPIVIGVGQCCEVLDPANSYSPQDWVYMMQIYPALFNAVPETDELVLDAAESAELINPQTMRIKVRDGLTFSNGNALTASDAVFSLNRQINIASENGPSPLWNNIKSVALLDEQTLEIVTTVPNDVTLKKSSRFDIWPNS